MNEVASTTTVLAGGITIDEQVRRIRLVRDKIKEIKERHKQELADFERLETLLEGVIIKFLDDTRQKSAKTEYGSAASYIRRSFSVQDQEEFRRHVIGTESWNLLTWAVTPTGAKEFETEHKCLPPGVKDSKLRVLSITAPPKPRLSTATTDVSEQTPGVETEETL
jgi:hypothetical protein